MLGALLGAFMAVLNIQITNASLLYIEGGIGTGVDNGAWITTAYLIGEIIVIPLTDYLSRVFSFRRYLIVNTVLFLGFSVSCAFAQNLGQMIVLRGLQGFSGGVLIPMAFTLVLTKLPKAQQPIGLALFALTATFGPAIGPTIGGYLTETYGWQYIFFVNLVPGAVMVVVLWLTLERAADAALLCWRRGTGSASARWRSGSRALQTVLDEGNKDGWFDSPFIVRLALVAAVFLTLFVWIELKVGQTRRSISGSWPAAISDSARWRMSSSASRFTAPSISCRNISARCSATTPSRSALCWPGPACRSS